MIKFANLKNLLFSVALIFALGLTLAACQRDQKGEPAADLDPETAESVEVVAEPTTPPREDLRVTDLSFGTAINSYNVLEQRLQQFTPQTQIYAVVITDGNGPDAELKLVVTDPNGQRFAEESVTIKLNGSAAHPFLLQPTTPGTYLAEASIDGHLFRQNSFVVNAD